MCIYSYILVMYMYLMYVYILIHISNWGEPERAPHKREVRAVGLSVCLSVCLSFCPYVHDTKIYKSNINLRGTFSC